MQLDNDQTQTELMAELTALRQRLAELENAEAAQQQAEAALRRREREFSTLVENAPDMIVRFDTDLRHLYCNAAVERQLGISARAFLGKASQDIASRPAAQAEVITRSLRQVLETGAELEVEQSYATAFGLKHFQTRIVPERDAQGRIESLLAITRDVTARRQAEAEIDTLNAELQRLLAERTQRLQQEMLAHQHTEQALQDSETRFRVALDISLEAFTILRSVRDAQGRILDFEWTYANSAAGKILKQPPEKLVGQRLLAVLPENRANRLLFDRYARIVESGQGDEVELEYQSEGVAGWFRNMTVKLGDGVAIAFSDITARKHAEASLRQHQEDLERLVAERTQALRAAQAELQRDLTARQQAEEALVELKVKVGSQELYSVLVDKAADGFWLLDKQFMTVYVNPATEAMLGYTQAEMLGRSWYDFGDPAWVARAKELERRRESGVVEPHQFLFIHKAGRKVLARIATTPLYDQAGSFNGALGILSDITRQQEAEEALKIKDMLNAIAQSSGIGMCLINPDYTLAWYNDLLAQWFGALEKTKGRNCFEVFESREAICPNCPARAAFETGAVAAAVRSGITTSAGADRIIALTTSPIW